MALSSKVIKTGADLFYDPSFAGTIISKSVVDSTTAGTAITALEALSWVNLGKLAGLTVGLSLDNKQEINALNCGVGTIASLADRLAKITPTLLEIKNFDLWQTILGGKSITDASSKSEYYSQALSTVDLPLGRFKIASCPYQTGIITAGQERARDYYYLEKASLEGEIVIQFLNKGEIPTGSQFTLNGETGGQFFTHTKYGATEIALA